MPEQADAEVGEVALTRQREILASLKRRVRSLLGTDPAHLRSYRAEYERAFEHFEGHSSKAELVAEARAADVVFCGDYHTLLQSQKTTVKVLREVVPYRKVVLALEVVRARDQRHLDAFMAGAIGEQEFLRRIDYDTNWGFPWDHYRIFFDFARAHHLPVVALDLKPPAKDPDRLLKRDAFAAQVLAQQRLADPAALLWVVFGDLHLAPAHLPAQLEAILAGRGERVKTLLIYQNNKHLYFQLAERGHHMQVDTVRLRAGMYCILNTPPWIKLRTYLDHLETKVFPAYDDDEEAEPEENPDYEDFVHQMVQEIARLVKAEGHDLANFQLYSRHHAQALQSTLWVPGPPETLAALLATAQVFYFPRDRVVLLTAFDSNHAAEAAGEFVHHLTSGYRATARDPVDAFYLSAIVKTFGFFASLLMNPKRKTDYFKDHDLFLERWRGKPLKGKRARQREVSRRVVQHQRAMERVMAVGAGRPRLRAVYQQDPSLGFGVSHALGTIMGDKLFRAVLGGQYDQAQVKALFHHPLDRPGEPYALYLQLRLEPKAELKPFKSKDEFF